MHELSITQSILDIATEHATQAGAKRITNIHLVVGELSGFVDDSIQFYFDLLSPNTIAGGARLDIRRVPIRLRCRTCGSEFPASDSSWECPNCRAVGGEVLSGKEFLVESIEIE